MNQPNKKQVGALLDADLYKQARVHALAEDRPIALPGLASKSC